MFPTNPWLAALVGLAQAATVMAGMILFGAALNVAARVLVRHPREQWQLLRVDRFWLVNTILAPFMLAIFALFAWLFRLTPTQIGFNLHNLGTSLIFGIGLGLLMGLPSAIAAPIAARQGYSLMRVQFGRTLVDVIGAIFYAAVLVGPLEEIPFRGIIQTLLMHAMPQAAQMGPFSAALGTFVAAALFVLYHYRNVMLGGETRAQFVRQLPGRSIASLILSLLFQSTGSLLGPILYHNLIDTCTIAALSITLYRMRRQGRFPPPPPVTPAPATPLPPTDGPVPTVGITTDSANEPTTESPRQ
jgi:membrane protease YdiL (CAAX protease family)